MLVLNTNVIVRAILSIMMVVKIIVMIMKTKIKITFLLITIIYS